MGTPLKDWDIKINRGILTGYNEAFIINKEKRDELIAQDPKSAEIIRPILRGKDIKRYSYEFADKYLITTYNAYVDSEGNKNRSVSINDYPAVKSHLDKYWDQISRRQDKGDTPYNLRRCTYMDDFNKPKIIFSRISGSEPCFALDLENHMINDTGYMIVGESLDYLLEKLCSPIYWYAFKQFYMGGGIEKEFKVNNLENLPIPLPNNQSFELTEAESQFISESLKS
ncbi:TaqI-like C-terminal specificity domain-containing protein [Lactococcus petauri]|uniref:TaqI-like C-terminal specificity domain-containing protein n=1 Tax=Lactococcus petauri TaxID=1940789 RepID=UPI003851B181